MRLTTSGLQSASRLRPVLPETAIVKWRRREPIPGGVDLMLVGMGQAMSRQQLPKHREWFKFANLLGKRRSPRRDQPSQPVVKNANRTPRRRLRRKRALLVYLPRAFASGLGERQLLSHQSLLLCRRMVQVLGELGYEVDVAHKHDRDFAPSRRYQLVIGDRQSWEGAEHFFSPSAIQVFLVTSMSHATHNRNVRRRHDRLLERGRAPIQVRRVYGETLQALRNADALVGVGNEFTMGTWREAYDGPIHGFRNFALPGTDGLVERRDFTRARRSFLYFASGSQMQKGLDLLLEIFPHHPGLELYVCSRFEREEDFCSSYRRELFETENVHPVGWVQVNSPQFLQLVSRCGSVVYPSCSDGQAGAVVQCLATGLVPLVTRESGVDTEDYGITFVDDSVETIEQVILEVAERPPDWHEEHSRRARHAADTVFTLDRFADRWRSLISEIVGAGPRRA
jgi:glycosyltransferase involved in cell wall biosynthesis